KSKDPDIQFENKFPEGEFLKPEHLGYSIEEFLQGIYLDINHETKPQKLDKSKILSLGIGRNTKF
ncbi:MAG: hypothetical protein ACTSX4_00980, partial [Candidatus Helarchaeota archaeon]